jgi:hypothetical protein
LGRITGYSNLEKDKSDMNSSRKQWHGWKPFSEGLGRDSSVDCLDF